MKIEVWRGDRLIRSTLYAFTSQGTVFTYLRLFKSPMKTPRRLRLSDELAYEILGSERQPCPYVGMEPRSGYYSEGYYANRREVLGGSTNISRHCMSCGYDDVRQYAPILTHPVTDHLVSPKYRQPFTEAGWDDIRGVLTPDKSDDRLILWIKPAILTRNPTIQARAQVADISASEAAFPNSSVLGDRDWLRLLRQPQPASVAEQVRTN